MDFGGQSFSWAHNLCCLFADDPFSVDDNVYCGSNLKGYFWNMAPFMWGGLQSEIIPKMKLIVLTSAAVYSVQLPILRICYATLILHFELYVQFITHEMDLEFARKTATGSNSKPTDESFQKFHHNFTQNWIQMLAIQIWILETRKKVLSWGRVDSFCLEDYTPRVLKRCYF